MKLIFPAIVAVLGCLVACAGTDADRAAIDLQRRMIELRAAAERLSGAGEMAAALEVVAEMERLDPEHPRIYVTLVNLYNGAGRLDEALVQIEAIESKGSGHEYGRGRVAMIELRYDEAERHFFSALEDYQRVGHLGGTLACHGAIGYLFQKLGRTEEARAHYEKTSQLAERLEDLSALGKTVALIGSIEIKEGHADLGLERLAEAVEICERGRDPDCVASLWNQVGIARRRRGESERAVDAYGKAAEIYQRLGNPTRATVALESIGEIYRDLEDWAAAVDHYERAEIAAAEAGDSDRVARVRDKLARVWLLSGDPARAAALMRLVADHFRSTPERTAREAWALMLLGKALIQTSEFAAATAVLEEAVAVAIDAGHASAEAGASSHLAVASAARGEYGRALAAERRTLELYRELGNDARQAVSLSNLGVWYRDLGDLDQARRSWELALDLAHERNDEKRVAGARLQLSAILHDLGEPELALRSATTAAEFHEAFDDSAELAEARLNVASSLTELGRTAEAREMLASALPVLVEHGNPALRASARIIEAKILRRDGRLDDALPSYAAALRIAEESGLDKQRMGIYTLRSEVLVQMERFDEARADHEAAMRAMETRRSRLDSGALSLRLMTSYYGLYEDALELTLATSPDDVGSAFLIAERARARSLTDSLAESRAALREGLPRDVLERELAIQDAVSIAAADLSRARPAEKQDCRLALRLAEEQLELFKQEIRAKSPRYGLAVHPEPASISEVRQLLRPDEVLLNYHVDSKQALLWVVARGGVQFHDLGSPDRLREAVDVFLEVTDRVTLAVSGRRSATSHATRLAALVLPELPEPGARLLVVPDGPLHHIPFGALRRDDRYLIEDHEVLVIPSATALQVMRTRPTRTSPGGFLGIGDPLGDDSRFPPLPHSRKSLDRISALFPEGNRTVLAGDRATKSAVRSQSLNDFRYIHFATHGWLDAGDPRRSGLRLTPESGTGADEFLYLDEIFSMNLASELVVLSSCRSGLGELLQGEGLVSLTRAFLYAGTRSLIVTLWDVTDRSTADFMEQFYRELAGGRSVADALRRTKVSFIESDRPQRRQPHTWAPFVLIGEPDPETSGNAFAAATTHN